MPRRLLLDGVMADDEWLLATDADARSLADQKIIVPFDRWVAEKSTFASHRAALGVQIAPTHRVENLVADLARFSLVAAEFPGPSDGRGYTQGRLLRERFGFRGELRASGYVRVDQVFFLARCGFNSFELEENEIAGARQALQTFTRTYQLSNDRGLTQRLSQR